MNQTTDIHAPLKVADDMAANWHRFREPVSIDTACAHVLARANEDGERHDEHVGNLGAWAVIPHADHLALAPLPVPGARVRGPYHLRNRAFSQLCAKIDAPAPYLKKLPAKLQLAALNWGASRSDGEALLRLAGGEARAMVSGRYEILDDRDVMGALTDSFVAMGLMRSAKVQSVATGNTLAMRVTFPSEQVEIQEGDSFQHGLDITNGECGNRAVGIDAISYRLVCTNGMRAWKRDAKVRFRHVGNNGKLGQAFRDAIPEVLAEARGQLDQWRRAVDFMVDDALGDIESLRQYGSTVNKSTTQGIARVFAANTLQLPPNSSVASVTDALNETPRTRVYDVANAVTEYAQTQTVDTRLELETLANRYLTRKVGEAAAVEL